MYVSEMLTLLDSRLEDPDRLAFPQAQRLTELWNAQMALTGAGLDPRFLTSLQYYAPSVSLQAGGSLPLSGLSPAIALDGRGVLAVKAYDAYNRAIWATEIKEKDITKIGIIFYAATSLDPYYWLANGRLYVLPNTTETVDVLYYRVPAPLLYLNTVTGVTSATQFRGPSTLSAADDHYNGAVVYSSQFASYHVVIAYEGATKQFTVSPAASNYFSSGTFSFITDPFTVLSLEGVEPQLNVALHPLLITQTEVNLWASCRDFDRMNGALARLQQEIAGLNTKAQLTKPKGLGYDEKGR